MYRNKKITGFTLIEILVVIAIIGVLTSVVVASVNQARVSSRDKARISDLAQAQLALKLYSVQNQTYLVAGTGYSGNGQGWFAYSDGTMYPKSISVGLYEGGFLGRPIADPLVPLGTAGSGDQRQYMHYFAVGGATVGSCMFAHLENPNSAQTETMNDTRIPPSVKTSVMNNYHMNYAVCQ